MLAIQPSLCNSQAVKIIEYVGPIFSLVPDQLNSLNRLALWDSTRPQFESSVQSLRSIESPLAPFPCAHRATSSNDGIKPTFPCRSSWAAFCNPISGPQGSPSTPTHWTSRTNPCDGLQPKPARAAFNGVFALLLGRDGFWLLIYIGFQ